LNLLRAADCDLLFFIEVGGFYRLNFAYTVSHFRGQSTLCFVLPSWQTQSSMPAMLKFGQNAPRRGLSCRAL
jgi:hypothetical protein